MKQLLKEHNIYTFIWCLYYLQGTLYAEGSIISRSLLIVFLLMSLKYFYKVVKMLNKPEVFTAINTLVIMFSIYGILRMIIGDDITWLKHSERFAFLKGYLISILPIYAFFYFGHKGVIDSKWFSRIVFVFIVIAIAQYYYQQAVAMFKRDADEVTNNTGYLFLALFPLITLLKKPIVQYTILIVSLIFIIMAMKRGAIIIGAICFAIFLFANMKEQSNSKKMLILFLSIGVILALNFILEDLLSNSDLFSARIKQTEEGDMSNRNDMYPRFLSFIFNQTNPIKILIGNGADGTLKLIGGYAHCDWLEIMMNHGLIGITLYVWYWISMFKTWVKVKNNSTSNIILAIGLFIIIYFMSSLFSMSINGMSLFATSVFGYCLAKYQQSYINQRKQSHIL